METWHALLFDFYLTSTKSSFLFLAHKGDIGKEFKRRSFSAGYNRSQSKLVARDEYNAQLGIRRGLKSVHRVVRLHTLLPLIDNFKAYRSSVARGHAANI